MELFGVCYLSLGWKWINWPAHRWGKVAWNNCIPAKQNKDGLSDGRAKLVTYLWAVWFSLGSFVERKLLTWRALISQAYWEYCVGRYICLSHVLLALFELQTLTWVINPKGNNLCHLYMLWVWGETVQKETFLVILGLILKSEDTRTWHGKMLWSVESEGGNSLDDFYVCRNLHLHASWKKWRSWLGYKKLWYVVCGFMIIQQQPQSEKAEWSELK